MTRQTFSVSIDVMSETLSLSELTRLLALVPSDESHDKGSPQPRGRRWNVTTWRVSSQVPESASLDAHCEDAVTRALAAGLFGPVPVPQDVKVVLNIAVFFDAAYCSIILPPSCLRAIRGYPIEVDVTCYPVSERVNP